MTDADDTIPRFDKPTLDDLKPLLGKNEDEGIEPVALQKLTTDEVDRMRDLYAMAPLGRRPIDDELIRKGWVMPYEGQEDTAVDTSWTAYGRTGYDDPTPGRAVLYLVDGTVDPAWRLPS